MKNQNTNIDGDLITNYLAGDKQALKLLIVKWHITFCNKAFWIVKDADLAKDIAQDTWQVIINKLNDLKEYDKFGSWATRIVYNKSIDVLNRRNREQISLYDYKYQHDNQSLPNEDNQDKRNKLLNAVKTLPNTQKQVLSLFYLESYSLKQISELLNISVGTAKSRLF